MKSVPCVASFLWLSTFALLLSLQGVFWNNSFMHYLSIYLVLASSLFCQTNVQYLVIPVRRKHQKEFQDFKTKASKFHFFSFALPNGEEILHRFLPNVNMCVFPIFPQLLAPSGSNLSSDFWWHDGEDFWAMVSIMCLREKWVLFLCKVDSRELK